MKRLFFIFSVILLFMGCRELVVKDYVVEYELSIENQSGLPLLFKLSLEGYPKDGVAQNLIELQPGNSTIIEGYIDIDTPLGPDNMYIAQFSYIEFYDPTLPDIMLTGMYYQLITPLEALADTPNEEILYNILETTDGGETFQPSGLDPVALFVPSETRAFYLERSATDSSKARLVITSAPAPPA